MSPPSQNASETPEPAPRIPQRKRGRERVAALLNAGAEVFFEKGYEAATMTEIAVRAGASIGSLYQFFPTKELLAKALHEAYLADLEAMLDGLGKEAAGLTPEEMSAVIREANPTCPKCGNRTLTDARPAFMGTSPAKTTSANHGVLKVGCSRRKTSGSWR